MDDNDKFSVVLSQSGTPQFNVKVFGMHGFVWSLLYLSSWTPVIGWFATSVWISAAFILKPWEKAPAPVHNKRPLSLGLALSSRERGFRDVILFDAGDSVKEASQVSCPS